HESMLMLLVRRVMESNSSVRGHEGVRFELLEGWFKDERNAVVPGLTMPFVLVHQTLHPTCVAEEVQLCTSQDSTPFLPRRPGLSFLDVRSPQQANLCDLDVDNSRACVIWVCYRLLRHEGIWSRS